MDEQDVELFRALQEEHGDALFAHALKLTGGDRKRTEDLVNETFLRAWEFPETLDPTSVRVWLFATARDVLALSAADVPDADRAVEAWTVAEALERLAPAHREVLVECFYRGRSAAEAGLRLGVPTGAVKTRAHYALRALRMTLDEMGVTR